MDPALPPFPGLAAPPAPAGAAACHDPRRAPVRPGPVLALQALSILRTFLGRATLLALPLLAPGAATAADAPTPTPAVAPAHRVLFLATSPVPAGKFQMLAPLARRYGIAADSRFVEKLPAEADAGLFAGYDAVFFDTPRDHLRDFAKTRLAKALAGLNAPALWLHESALQWQRLPDPLARRLHAYYVNGSRANFEGFFATLAAHLAGQPWAAVEKAAAAPIVFPKSAVYHPKAPGLVFADPADYLRWKGVDPAAPGRPVVAIALHQGYIAAEQTAFIDDLIGHIEAAGAIALPFYGPVMDPDGVRRMTRAAGRPVADVLINTQIMLNPEGRRAEFAALGIPVVQAMPYRKGDAAAWRADPQGVSLTDVPFYLAQAEYAGVTDIQIAAATRAGDDQVVPIPEQAAAVVGKALKQVRLQTLANAEKRVTVFVWNYPPGEKNLSASFMNLPRSLEATLKGLKDAGYRAEALSEPVLIASLQRLLAPFYRDDTAAQLDSLLRDGLADTLPVADYRRWLATLPEAQRQALARQWGEPEKSAMVLRRPEGPVFVIPRLLAGNLAILPQAPRGEKWVDKEKALYHSLEAHPSHFYLAAYLWARQRSDALVHFGTHGTQEWLPGKERGLSVFDWPMAAVGDVPVAYPYIVDNIGESLQAKRRGRAVIVSHQTPTFAPAGLHGEVNELHDVLHAWQQQDEGGVKDKLRADLLRRAQALRVDKDLGWSAARIAADFPAFVDTLHAHLHELAQTAQPVGLHTFGTAPAPVHRIGTAVLALGKEYWQLATADGDDPEESFVGDYRQLAASRPYRLLEAALAGEPPPAGAPARLRELLDRGRALASDLTAGNEIPGLLTVLAGRHLPTSYGGDPIKNPEALPTGRNLYGFDPSRVPTPAAFAAAKEALDNLLALHRQKTGRYPDKLAFSLWSVETMRHQGILEAQALLALGVEPVWDAGGRVEDVRLIPRERLGRPRVDVVLSATGLYRDHFPNAMRQLAKAVALAAAADEPDNPVAAHTREVEARLARQGVPEAERRNAARTRIFSSESGNYGTGLDDATLATDTWKGKAEGDRKLAELYLRKMQFAYGPDEATWGQAQQGSLRGINLYAEQLKGTQGAVLARSSNLYGMLTTDDPFQYLGGIGLAVRHLDGKAPELYISNLRAGGANGSGGRAEGAAEFLAKELATRNFHPGYIKNVMAEGYAGTLQVLDAVNNFWGWTATAREVVRDDQWQEFADVYVRDKHQLGLRDWFARNNPHALAQTVERMLEAARQGYWQADAKTVAELKSTYRELAAKYDVKSDNATFRAYVGAPAAAATGYGLGKARPASFSEPMPPNANNDAASRDTPVEKPADPGDPATVPDTPTIRGMKLEKIPEPATALPPLPLAALAGALLVFAAALGGALTANRPLAVRRPR
ncbi:cobaltochelatase subunit CobN [Oryzomicrobium sp.]|uniref:cobaltochelatase subunit CobN n=1 Tax=Oryzomicrobium sp. TaxID=1911578 RepID=UPI002FDFB3E3